MTMVSTGPRSTGRMMIRSMATPAMNEKTSVRPKAAQ